MALFIFTCRNPNCGCTRKVPLAEIPEGFWQGGYRNPGFFDTDLCDTCGADQPRVQVLPGGNDNAPVTVA